MYIVAVGLNYKTAPVEIREKVSFDPSQIPVAMGQLREQKGVYENILVSTCNRTEVYAVVDLPDTGIYYIIKFLAGWFDLDIEEFKKCLYIYEGDEAVNHLLNVTCGLNSMVLGETQILGQVRTSFMHGQEYRTIGVIFNRLLKQAITFAKKAHTETAINTNAVSISYAAVELAKKVFGALINKEVLVFGTGEMGQLAVENLYGSGADHITVINRTFEKAKILAEKFNGKARKIEELSIVMAQSDILISSTGAKDYVITKEIMEPIVKKRKGRPLFMVDIAVPRDIDPRVAELDGVFLYDIDDLQDIVQANLTEREQAAEQIKIMIKDEIVNFNQWISMLGVVPIIGALKEKAQNIHDETLKSMERKLPNLSDREWKVINKHMKSIVNQMLKDPILFAKDASDKTSSKHSLNAFVKIFNIEDLVEEQKVAKLREEVKFDSIEDDDRTAVPAVQKGVTV
ncbi:MAG: glutamyl-tRNA reductase [Bacillales bacterium]|jgi:glutamyl-tRNA reductase|nr:glutamyl-tRNA reductase [Bacillales bacterium]